jgi:hypothetical protein
MTSRTLWIVRALVVAIWLLFAWQAISGGIAQLSSAETGLQRAQSWFQVGYGVLSILVFAMTFRTSALARYVRLGWAAAVVGAAGLAPVAWGGTGWGIGALAAAVGVGIAAVLLWSLRFAFRDPAEIIR